mmetsp:Transcript_11803/g.16927  ORF Transcript_11803/g.16927 Transcript_11803/m.16927 type:complete len:84 (-) Transcript_11803:104-355(-)
MGGETAHASVRESEGESERERRNRERERGEAKREERLHAQVRQRERECVCVRMLGSVDDMCPSVCYTGKYFREHILGVFRASF